jgi:hypothetical protein
VRCCTYVVGKVTTIIALKRIQLTVLHRQYSLPLPFVPRASTSPSVSKHHRCHNESLLICISQHYLPDFLPSYTLQSLQRRVSQLDDPSGHLERVRLPFDTPPSANIRDSGIDDGNIKGGTLGLRTNQYIRVFLGTHHIEEPLPISPRHY